MASSEEDRQAIAEMCRLGLNAKISALCRGLNADMDQAVALGVWGVRLSFPISQLERKHKLKGISDDDYLKRALELCEYGRRKGLNVIFSPYDTTRAEIPFLRRLVGELEQAGHGGPAADRRHHRLRPARRRSRTSSSKSARQRRHCRSKFTATTISGSPAPIRWPASWRAPIMRRRRSTVSASAPATRRPRKWRWRWRCSTAFETGLDLTKLTAVSRLVAELSGVRTQVNKAVVGDSAFRHESGMVVAGLLQDPFTAEAYEPELVGQRRQILLGKKSGLVSIAYKVKELALPVPEQSFPEMLDRVKQAAVNKHRALTDDEFKMIANDLIA